MHARSRTLFSLLSLSTQLSRTSHECNKNNPKKTRETTLLIPSILLSAIIFAYVPLQQQNKTACLRLSGKLCSNVFNCSSHPSLLSRLRYITLQLFTLSLSLSLLPSILCFLFSLFTFPCSFHVRLYIIPSRTQNSRIDYTLTRFLFACLLQHRVRFFFSLLNFPLWLFYNSSFPIFTILFFVLISI